MFTDLNSEKRITSRFHSQHCQHDKHRICVNVVKHRQIEVFTNKALQEKHTITCYGHVAVKSVPPVEVEVLDLEDQLPGHGIGRGKVKAKAN